MPRHNYPPPRRPRPSAPTDQTREPAAVSTDLLARELVRRGLASALILHDASGRPPRPIHHIEGNAP